MKLTPRQTQILELIRSHLADTGFPPTRAEIAEALGFRSVNSAEEHLRALAKKGAIELLKGTSRGIRLLESEKPEADLPVVGQVAAGQPILAQEHIEERYDFSPDLFQPRADYLLRVQGMSMKDIGIMDGDLLAVHCSQDVRNGQIVVARIEDEVTVKRFFRDERSSHLVVLLPENDDFEPIRVDLREQSLTIEGLGVGVLRQGLGAPFKFR
jgi:repressor LexA